MLHHDFVAHVLPMISLWVRFSYFSFPAFRWKKSVLPLRAVRRQKPPVLRTSTTQPRLLLQKSES